MSMWTALFKRVDSKPCVLCGEEHLAEDCKNCGWMPNGDYGNLKTGQVLSSTRGLDAEFLKDVDELEQWLGRK